MTPERFRQIDELISLVLKHEERDRKAFLDEACAGDAELRREVDSLLACDEKSGTFLGRPAVQLVARALAEDAEGEAKEADTATAPPGAVGRYLVERELGSGGMGSVYVAYDPELGRKVAIKLIRPEGPGRTDPGQSRARLLREAQALAQLTHPNVIAIHDVGTFEGQVFIAMEYVAGCTLTEWLAAERRTWSEIVSMFVQAGRGLAAAHAQGIVHRDFKPDNVWIGKDARARVLDFGLARATWTGIGAEPPRPDGQTRDQTTSSPHIAMLGTQLTQPGKFLGTPAYMAPEQLNRGPVDARTDQFSFCVALHQALHGELPFTGDSVSDLLTAIEQRRISEGPNASHVPARLRRVLRRGLSPDRADRFDSMDRLIEQLDHRPVATWRRVLVTLVAIVIAAMALWLVRRESRIRWAVGEALPRISQLVEHGEYPEAFALAEKVEHVLPDDPRLLGLWPRLSHRLAIETAPGGADVYVRRYAAPESGWRYVGKSPITSLRLPLEPHQLRIEKRGFASVESVPKLVALAPVFGFWWGAPDTGNRVETLRFVLDEVGRFPPEMVHVPGGTVAINIPGLDHLPPVRLGDYLIDRTEVTNNQFKRFVDSGGYLKPELWKHAFVKDGRALSWNEVMALFRDRTGRPGPATWESGDYPEGQGELPVTGVSWYEAAAYAAFVGKALPNVYQWSQASGAWASSQIIPHSNFRGQGLAPVASYRGMGPFGTYDMAGNANEWCWNASGSKRFILGGAWNEPEYMFNVADAHSPFLREPNYGFRLAKALDDNTDPVAALPVSSAPTDYSKEKPVPPDVFRVFKRMYVYDKRPLDARVEATEDTDRWHREKVTFAAAYGGERIIGYLFTPRHVRAPYQTVVFFPGASVVLQRSSEDLLYMRILTPLINSGRAVFYPVYKSTYERGDDLTWPTAAPTASYREHVIRWSMDLGRSIDYLETREELDSQRLAFYGLSWGARLGPLLVAVEDRVRVAMLLAGGLRAAPSMAEAEPFNFAPYARQPILMLNGRYDFIYRIDAAELLFKRLGSSEKDKRHVISETAHVLPNDLVTKEVLEWLDRYFGSTGR